MIEVREPISEEMLRDAKTGALLAPRPRITRVFYIGVGDRPPSKARTYADQMISELTLNIDNFNYENFFLVVRETEHRIEVFHPPVVAPTPAPPKVRRWWKLRWPHAR